MAAGRIADPYFSDFASVGESRLYRRYAADRGKFISEFGIHGSPELSTLRRRLPDDQLQVHSPGFDHHNKDHPKKKHDPVLEIITGLPINIEQLTAAVDLQQFRRTGSCDAEVTLARFSAAPDLVAAVAAEVGPA